MLPGVQLFITPSYHRLFLTSSSTVLSVSSLYHFHNGIVSYSNLYFDDISACLRCHRCLSRTILPFVSFLFNDAVVCLSNFHVTAFLTSIMRYPRRSLRSSLSQHAFSFDGFQWHKIIPMCAFFFSMFSNFPENKAPCQK